MIANQRQALDARLKQFRGEGTVRSAAPGTTFTPADHPEHDLDLPEQRKFLITAVTYEARNALEANATGLNGFDSRCCAYGVAIAVLTEMKFPDAQGRVTLEYPEGYTPRRS